MDDFAKNDPDGTAAAHETGLRTTVAMQSSTVLPYLFFAGRCEEALNFYKASLGATVTMLMRFRESPDPIPDGMLQPGFENKVMHASFTVGKMMLMASDGCNDNKSTFEGFRLALSVPTVEDCDRVFSALADGGKVDMPLAMTFWSPRYGLVTDRFGVGWMVMVSGDPQ